MLYKFFLTIALATALAYPAPALARGDQGRVIFQHCKKSKECRRQLIRSLFPACHPSGTEFCTVICPTATPGGRPGVTHLCI
jgi:hypothetical protein